MLSGVFGKFLFSDSSVKIDRSLPVTSDNLFLIYAVVAVLALLCIFVILYFWNRKSRNKDVITDSSDKERNEKDSQNQE